MKKIDTHSHSSGASPCSTVNPKGYALAYKNANISTVMLTNHYSHHAMWRYGDTFDSRMQNYLDEYYMVKNECDKLDVTLLLGAEVAIESKTSPYNEYILYGVTEDFLLENPNLYDMNQAKLYKLCNKNNILMYQAHPYRKEQGHLLQDTEYMDGVEINCHSAFTKDIDKVINTAHKYNLNLSCGSDFHYASQAGNGGVLGDVNIDTSKKLADYLRKNKYPQVFFDANNTIDLSKVKTQEQIKELYKLFG